MDEYFKQDEPTQKKRPQMDWIKQHVDTVIVLGALITCMMWMNTRFNEIDGRFSGIDKEMAVLKTVLIMKNIMPCELAKGPKHAE